LHPRYFRRDAQRQMRLLPTLPGRLDLSHMHSFVAGFADAPFVSISNSQRGAFETTSSRFACS
jgi:hypothetical protein